MKLLKRALSWLLVCCMVISMVPAVVFAETTEVASGTCGENLTWVLDDAGKLFISGTGPMEEYNVQGSAPWYYTNCSKIESIVIGEGVTTIGTGAFASCTEVATVDISNSITMIGASAFRGCIHLREIVIPDSVGKIGGSAFFACSALTNITVPEGVTEIGLYAFRGCDSLVSVSIPDSLTYIGERAFYGCDVLSEIVFCGNAPTFASDVFDDVTTTAFYPADNVTWTSDVMQDYGGTITWVPYGANDDALVYLETLEICASDRYTGNQGDSFINVLGTRNGTVDIHGNQMEHGLEAWIARWNFKNEISWAWVEYELDAQYTNLSGKLTIISDCYNSTNFDATIEILGDGILLCSASLKPGMEVVPVDVDISGVNTLRIYVYDNTAAEGGTSFGLWDFAVSTGDGATEGSSPLEIDGLSINRMHDNFYIFQGDPHVYNMDAPDSVLYLGLGSISVIDDSVLSPADITWTSSDEDIFKVISSGDPSDVSVNLRVEGITEGTATLTATNPDGESISLDVTVVKPNALHLSNVYDTKQYYHEGAFYSAASSISDSVEIFMEFANKQIEGYPCEIEEELTGNVSVIEPITLTATILGAGLSFDRNSYQSTYSATYDAIDFNKGIYDLLMLFPYDTESFTAGSSYTVEVTLESDSFEEPVKETYSFTVYDAETQRVDEHINFLGNSTYKVSKQNFYGTNMLELKDDPEYNWSVVTSLDFDNYYEIVLADLLVDMLDVYQVNTSIVPAILKDWHGTYKSLLGDVTTMVNDSCTDIFDVSEMKIDKVLKVSKYTKASDGIYANDDVYQVVLDMLGNVGNVEKIQTFFAAVDDTKSAFSIVKLTGDVVKDFVAWGNSIAVLNAFVETDENFKQVFRQIANNIPDCEKKMKEAIEDYINYSEDFAGQFSEIYDSFCDLGVDVALDTFDGIVGKKLWDWAAAKAIGWIGKIPLSGGTATFASTTAYASLTTAIGTVATGVSLGLCLSDLICDSSDKAAEMSKIIAMSEYAPYIIQTLEYYEDNLYSAADNSAVNLFEKALGLHKASQSYIMDHTVSALRVKADSILQTILGNDDYDELVADILVQKNAIDSMECCGALTNDTIVQTIKVIAIKCPVDVYIYNENGTEIVKIIGDTLGSAADGINVYIRDGAKFITLPSTQVYTLKIIATDGGTMDYLVMEFDEASQLVRRLEECSIPLAVDRVFSGEVVEELGVVPESYALTYENTEYVPTDPDHAHTYATVSFYWYDNNTCTATFTCVDGDDTQTLDCSVTSETTPATGNEDGRIVYTAAIDFNGQTYTDTKTVTIPAVGVARIFGATRYDTAFKAADQRKSNLGIEKFENIVVAYGEDFADALSGSYLANQKNAPILLVKNRNKEINAVKDYIRANLTSGGTVYLLGGVNAVPKAMETGLEGFNVKRLAGATRYETNLEILKEAGISGDDILVCTGLDFADGLSASAVNKPILLVKDSLRATQVNYLKTLGTKNFYLIGGTNAVNKRIESALAAYGTTQRIEGATRYYTSVNIAKTFFPNAKTAVLAYAQNFPDGLSGGCLACSMNAPLILTANGKQAPAVAYAKEAGITGGAVLGGTGLIPDRVVNAIFRIS